MFTAARGAHITEQNIQIPTSDGATVCAMVVRPDSTLRLPAALEFTIYVDPKKNLERLEYAADRGYAGVMAYTRGKACSPQDIIPYEHDGRDADSVIDWIAKQPWSDGQVGMMGGSYDGFTQWAALALYEMLPDGLLFQLTYYTERASYAADMSTRHLLKPDSEATIPFEQNYLFTRLIAKGSRLLLTVNVNKNAFAEINYGTGKDVSTEDIGDADSPMQVDWLTSSYIRLRLHDPEASQGSVKGISLAAIARASRPPLRVASFVAMPLPQRIPRVR